MTNFELHDENQFTALTILLPESMSEWYAAFYGAELAKKGMHSVKESALKCKYNGGGVPVEDKIDEKQ